MKKLYLLCLVALLIGTSAQAKLSADDLAKPTPTSSTFTTDETFYLYNVEAQKYYSEGNAWGTQASLDDDGLLMYFEEISDGVYTLHDYSNARTGWYLAFFDNDTQIFVDRGSQANYYWGVETVSGNTFRLYASATNPTYNCTNYPNQYVGLDASTGSTALSPFLTVADNHYINWYLVSAEDKDGLDDKVTRYNAALSLCQLVEEAKNLFDNEDYVESYRTDLTTYVTEIDNTYDANTISTEDAQNLQTKLQSKVNAVLTNPARDGADVTAMLTNPNYEDGTTGWTVTYNNDASTNVRVGGNSQNHCFEAWNNSAFDIYQEISDLPFGVYEIQVQGYYRYLRGDNAWNAYNNAIASGTKMDVPVYIYMNNNATKFQNIFDEPVAYGELYTDDPSKLTEAVNVPYVTPNGEYWFPNDMNNSATAFHAGMYKQSAYGLVSKKGDVLRLGVKGSSNQGNDSWVIWDDFKLIYRGHKADIVKPVLELAMEEAQEYKDSLMSKSAWSTLSTGFELAEQGIESNDGDVMFNALITLYDAKDAARVSSKLFYDNQMRVHAAALNDAIQAIGEQTMSKQIKKDAKAMYASIMGNTFCEDDEIEDGINRIYEMINAINNSISYYQTLSTLVVELKTAITEATEKGVSVTLIKNANSLHTSAVSTLGLCNKDNDAMAELNDNICDMRDKLYVAIDNIPTSVTIALNPARTYTSYCSEYALDFSNNANVRAYRAELNGDCVKITSVDYVPAGTGVVLRNLKGGSSAVVPFVSSASVIANNSMVGALEATTLNYNAGNGNYNYVLSNNAFHPVADGTTLAAGKAYLQIPYDVTASGVKALSVVEENEETGISELRSNTEETIYNLQGIRVNTPAKGMYIVNGKKVLY